MNRKALCPLNLNPAFSGPYRRADKMLRKGLVAVLALLLVLAVAHRPAWSAASVEPTPAELVLLKKKRKVEAEAKARQEAEWKQAGIARRQRSPGDRCEGFLACLSGKPRAGGNDGAVSDRSTARSIAWDETQYAPGSIVVRTPERMLYLVLDDGTARRYRVGVGREGFQWSGVSHIAAKQEWPAWRPPPRMIEREAAKGNVIPEYMEGGPENPLGARALYIGGTMFRIHGTNNAGSIGGAVSSGCIRMMNADVIDLYDRVGVGAPVYVYQ